MFTARSVLVVVLLLSVFSPGYSAPPPKFVGEELLPDFVMNGERVVVDVRGLHVTNDFHYLLGTTNAKPPFGQTESLMRRILDGMIDFGSVEYEQDIALRRVVLLKVSREACLKHGTTEALGVRSMLLQLAMSQMARPDKLVLSCMMAINLARSKPPAYEWVDLTPSSKELPAISDDTFWRPGAFDIDTENNLWVPMTPVTVAKQRILTGPSSVLRIKIASDGPLRQLEREVVFTSPHMLKALFCEEKQEAILGLTSDSLLRWNRQGKLLSQSSRPQGSRPHRYRNGGVHSGRSTPQLSFLAVRGGEVWFGPGSQYMDQFVMAGDGPLRTKEWMFAPSAFLGSSRFVASGGMHGWKENVYFVPDDIGRGAKVLIYALDQ